MAFRRATGAPRVPTAGRVSHRARTRLRRGTRQPGRPSTHWTPTRQRRLLRLWLCAHGLNMTQICGLLEEDDFRPKETATYEQLNSLLSVLEDMPAAVLRPNDRAAMRTRMHVLRNARTKAIGRRRATTTTNTTTTTAAETAAPEPSQPHGTRNPQLVNGAESATLWSGYDYPCPGGSQFYVPVAAAAAPAAASPPDRPARASFLKRHSTATCQLVFQVARQSRTLSWLADVASLLSGLTRSSSTATQRSSATSTSTKRISDASSSNKTTPEPSEPWPRLSQDSPPPRFRSDSEQKPDTAAQVATFLSNKAIVAKCCAAGDGARLCAHRRLLQVIGSVLPGGQESRRAVVPPFVVSKREVNTPDALGNTLVHVAAAWGAPIPVLVDILERSDNVSTINNNLETFLHVFEPCPFTTTAATFHELVSYLYKRGFKFHQLDAQGRTCLSRLVTRPSFPLGALSSFAELPAGMGKFFLEHRSRRGEQLHHAICRRLNDQKFAVPQDDDDAETNLARQICAGGLALGSGLDSHPRSPSLSPPQRSLSPQDAAEPGDDLLDCLIHYDLHVNHQASRTGRTPLMMVLARLQPGQQICGKVELALARLIYKGARLDLRDHKGETALHYAVRLGLPNVVELLCAHDADVNATNHRALTPFHLAQLGIRDPHDLLSSPRMAVRFLQCATILAKYAAVQTPPPPMPR
ncbi:hypothetical protein QBC47DRAFT_336457 [Echria macrotheca]|uniref:Uncharacterized protein n=1 Tax=Echria macrotheca TaxID=438768 RepID=A0AAJ0FEM5_9PEZI|nr:hypothetical protein QBC47DRAFT_336457 [Echria macrotheca]